MEATKRTRRGPRPQYEVKTAANARLTLVRAGCDSEVLDRHLESYAAAVRAAEFARNKRAEFGRRVAASQSTLRRLRDKYRKIARDIKSDGYRLDVDRDHLVAEILVAQTSDEEELELVRKWVPMASVPQLIGGLGDFFERHLKFQRRAYGAPQDGFVVEEEYRFVDYVRTATSHPHFEKVALLLEGAALSALDNGKTPSGPYYGVRSVAARYWRIKKTPRTPKTSDKGRLAGYLG